MIMVVSGEWQFNQARPLKFHSYMIDPFLLSTSFLSRLRRHRGDQLVRDDVLCPRHSVWRPRPSGRRWWSSCLSGKLERGRQDPPQQTGPSPIVYAQCQHGPSLGAASSTILRLFVVPSGWSRRGGCHGRAAWSYSSTRCRARPVPMPSSSRFGLWQTT